MISKPYFAVHSVRNSFKLVNIDFSLMFIFHRSWFLKTNILTLLQHQHVTCYVVKMNWLMYYLLQLFGLSWSKDGRRLASICRRKTLRVFDPRAQPDPVQVRFKNADVKWSVFHKKVFVVTWIFTAISLVIYKKANQISNNVT